MNSNSKMLTPRQRILRCGIRLVLGIMLASLILSCSPKVGLTPAPTIQTTNIVVEDWSVQPEINFGFILEYGSCYTRKLDTVRGEFTQVQGAEPSITIPLKLSTEQLKIIYQKMREIHLTQYPAIYAIPTHAGEVVGFVTPASHYNLKVVNGKSTTTITWTDEIIKPTAPEADRLRELLKMIIQMISENPDGIELPKLKFLCA